MKQTLNGETPILNSYLFIFFISTLIPHSSFGLKRGVVFSSTECASSLTKRTKEHRQKVGPGLWAQSLG